MSYLKLLIAEELRTFRFKAQVRDDDEEAEEVNEWNPFHKSDGTWGSEEEATCKSTFFKDRKRDRVKGGKTLSLTNRGSTGRGLDKDSHGDRRCRDDKKLFQEEGQIVLDKESFRRLVADELASVIKDWESFLDETAKDDLVTDNKNEAALMLRCRQLGLMNFQGFLKSQNLMSKSQKGDLFKKEKAD